MYTQQYISLLGSVRQKRGRDWWRGEAIRLYSGELEGFHHICFPLIVELYTSCRCFLPHPPVHDQPGHALAAQADERALPAVVQAQLCAGVDPFLGHV
jgi:hypothetical protein